MLSPVLILYAMVVLYPAGAGAVASLTSWNGLDPTRQFVGIANFSKLLTDPNARSTVANTAILAVVVVVVQTLLGLLIALILHEAVPGRGFFKVVFFAPVVLAPIAVSYTWRFILEFNGPLNVVLSSVGLGAWKTDWLGNPDTALLAICAMVIWQYLGSTMVIFLAGLQAISPEYSESASTEGASWWQTLRYIRIPLLRPTIALNVVLSTIGALKTFDQVFVTTQGGPGTATETLSTFLFRQAFTYGNYGYGAAVALILALASLIVAGVLRRVISGRPA